jgi:hypothetical protein
MRPIVSVFLLVMATGFSLQAGDTVLVRSEGIYAGWLQMYDLKFDDAHRTFAQWMEGHPADSLGPASDAAAYLFSELARLGVLESELFVDNNRFVDRKKLVPDPQVKLHFTQQIDRADQLANVTLQTSDKDANALFVKSLTCGLRADYAALVQKENLTALSYTKQGRPFADKLLSLDPNAFDAYLGPGIENYLLSLKAAPIRFFLRLTGSKVDREKGLEQLQKTAQHGYYFEPFAKLLLAVAALRDNNRERAREILTGLRDRFPENKLYSRELERLKPGNE